MRRSSRRASEIVAFVRPSFAAMSDWVIRFGTADLRETDARATGSFCRVRMVTINRRQNGFLEVNGVSNRFVVLSGITSASSFRGTFPLPFYVSKSCLKSWLAVSHLSPPALASGRIESRQRTLQREHECRHSSPAAVFATASSSPSASPLPAAKFLRLGCLTKMTRADRFSAEMNRVVPWKELLVVVEPHTGSRRPAAGRRICCCCCACIVCSYSTTKWPGARRCRA